ncbi:putative outer-membrane immunogenic protein [Bradyrhizobium oligotrophicum S58]|uniref:Putative outer-membrane immunogenic protein n=1 Tax=Bradyrhizobium oligotrophicum S58 TaxID=1245469 RepID=M5A2L3_9BRAD|nr:outer membrane beta-barrel protein [Bradyrhizobium oligotrophicum]BAM93115.1 putative outer-membrane immunogenic protein [Bradyrhizobium oligotrophicum S58]
MSVVLAGSALAADLAVKAPPVAAPSWTGFYAGVSVGGRWADNDWRTSDIAPAFGAGTFVPTAGTSGPIDSVAARIGGYLGINWQFGPTWVAGLEGDFGWADNNKTASPLPGTAGLFFGTPMVGLPAGSVKDSWDGSVRARLGYLVAPDTLVYGSGGVAWQRVELNANCALVPGNAFCFGNPHNETFGSTRVGWTAGGGIEHMIGGHWIVRADYRYADFGTWTQTFFIPGGVGPGFDDRFTAHVTTRTHTATIGLAYKF